MTRVPTTTTDPLRATPIAGNGFRGEKSPAASPTGDFLQSLLTFSSGMATQSITTDLRFNQLVGALQLNRPGGPQDDFGSFNSRAAASSLDNSPSDTDELGEDDPDSERDSGAARRRASAEDLANSDGWAGQLWAAPIPDPRFRQTGSGDDENGSSDSLSELVDLARFANRRSDGFPTAERAAAIELARRESLQQADSAFDSLNAVGSSIDRVALRRDRGGNVAGSEGGLRLEGDWQRVFGGETLAGGIGRNPSTNTAAADGVANLLQPGQLDPLAEGQIQGGLPRALNDADEPGPGWQLSFQSDRAGVRSGRLNSGAKAKAREGLKPDGVGSVERVVPTSTPGIPRHEPLPNGLVVRPGSQLSLDELSLAPAAARAMWESGLGEAVAPGIATGAAVAAVTISDHALSGISDSAATVGAPSAGETPGMTASATPLDSATSDLTLSGVATRGETAMAADAGGAVPELAGGPRTLPARVLNQVAQALRDAPAGDSTLRLQLNPVDLGQLSIEISFRDGVMHGKLRAEQGQTLKWLQEGLDGLKARLSEQGIVVQALEVELGQQGDFSQQSGSFSPGPDFGRQRSGRGYFTPDGSNRRAAAAEQEITLQPSMRDTSGQWAVNVIV